VAVLSCWRPRRVHVIHPKYRSGTRHHPCHVLADLRSNIFSIPCKSCCQILSVESHHAYYYHLSTYRLQYCRKDTKKPQVGESIAAAQHRHASQTKSRQRRAPPGSVCLYTYHTHLVAFFLPYPLLTLLPHFR
jgi:hypothetical protein